jgi:plastocyanin
MPTARNSPAMLLVMTVTATAIGVAGCSSNRLTSDTATASVTPAPATVPAVVPGTITIQSFHFGASTTVSLGQSISIVNLDSAPHTVTADDGHSFDANVAPAGRATFVAPTVPGSYPFHCTVHPDMHGTLVVT